MLIGSVPESKEATVKRNYGIWLAHLAAMGIFDGSARRRRWVSVGPEPHEFTEEEIEKIKADIRAKRARRKGGS